MSIESPCRQHHRRWTPILKNTEKGGCAHFPDEDFNKQGTTSSENTAGPSAHLLLCWRKICKGNKSKYRILLYLKLGRDRAMSIGMLCAQQDQPHGQLTLPCPGVCLPMKVLPVLLPRAGTRPLLQHEWPGSCAMQVGWNREESTCGPSLVTHLCQMQSLEGTTVHSLSGGSSSFPQWKNTAYRVVLPFGQAADSMFNRIVHDPEKQSSYFVLVFFLVAVVNVRRTYVWVLS